MLLNSFSHELHDRTNVVLELKYAQDKERHAEQVAGHFPFRMTKSSKYTSGIEKLYAW